MTKTTRFALTAAAALAPLFSIAAAHAEERCQAVYKRTCTTYNNEEPVCTPWELDRIDCEDDGSTPPTPPTTTGGGGDGTGGNEPSEPSGGGGDTRSPCTVCLEQCQDKATIKGVLCTDDVTRTAAQFCSTTGMWPDGSIRQAGRVMDDNCGERECIKWESHYYFDPSTATLDYPPQLVRSAPECKDYRDKKNPNECTREFYPADQDCLDAWTGGMPSVSINAGVSASVGTSLSMSGNVGVSFSYDPSRGLYPGCATQAVQESLACPSTCSTTCGD